MEIRNLVKQWFSKWESGDFLDLPVSEDFKHTSPYGTITGKKNYMNVIEANKDKFLGHHFEIHNEIYEEDMACIRYTAVKDNFKLDVSEWHFLSKGQINEIVAYYNITGEISNEKKLNIPK